MCGMLDGYLAAFADLQTGEDQLGTALGAIATAQHQSVLLLSVLELIDSGYIKRNFISPDQELLERYTTILSRVTPQCATVDMSLPFQDLQNNDFWQLVASDPQRTDHQRVGSLPTLQEQYLGARLAKDLYPLLLMPSSRNKLKEVLLRTLHI